MEITVDAYSGRVYQGRVPELLALQEAPETPHDRAPRSTRPSERIADLIIPLHLLDPKAPDLRPGKLPSLHDISRLVHEFSYKVMFQISDLVSDEKGGAVKLAAPIPLDLYIIDLGGVWPASPRSQQVTRWTRSFPFPSRPSSRACCTKTCGTWSPGRSKYRGCLSVMREQMLAPPQADERFGDRSYAIISDKYLNFSSRVGYHYSILDSYCGDTVNKNYITFSFKGGRGRRRAPQPPGAGHRHRPGWPWISPWRSRATGWTPGSRNTTAP